MLKIESNYKYIVCSVKNFHLIQKFIWAKPIFSWNLLFSDNFENEADVVVMIHQLWDRKCFTFETVSKYSKFQLIKVEFDQSNFDISYDKPDEPLWSIYLYNVDHDPIWQAS